MNPRLKTSKKWTAFPKEYVEQISQVFSDAFAAQLVNGKLIVEGRIYQEEITLRVGFLENGRLQQANFEVSVNYNQKENQDAVKGIHNCIDAAASMMGEYFASEGSVDFPRQWKQYDFNGQSIYVQYNTENSDLEAEANRLLGIDNESLVREESESEDALEKASARLEPEDEDESENDNESDSETENDGDSDEYEASEDDDSDETTDDQTDLSKPTLFSSKKRKKSDQLH